MSMVVISEMALMGHGTFNSNKICFVLMQIFITYLILILFQIQEVLRKNNSKKLKKEKRKKLMQSSNTDILDFKPECAKMFLMWFC